MADNDKKPILIVEDDYNIVEVIRSALEGLGYPFEHADDGQDALDDCSVNDYALVILDVNLPSLSGLEVCRALRSKKPLLPILMLTARGEEVDKVLGLELGADDYLVKPFSTRELSARAKALLRRSEAAVERAVEQLKQQDRYCLGSLAVDFERRKVYRSAEEVPLTALEYDLLAFLAQHAGRPFTREQIVEHVWQYEGSGYDRTVTVLVNRIRAKIEDDPAKPKYLLTERGVGYRMAELEIKPE
ncbi:MAG TPA: response regulator transcription factor [Oligoflexia bacterium]|nr:response regulator transcription factor [Oligoflexia bacterium]